MGLKRCSHVALSLCLSGACILVCALDVCGNYCGPTWCSGQVTPECKTIDGRACVRSSSDCTESGPTDGSCADECCKTHDHCCGSSDRSGCNDAIISCLKLCSDPSAKTCYHGSVPVPYEVVLTAMRLDPYDCCGTSCSETGVVGVNGTEVVPSAAEVFPIYNGSAAQS